MRKIIFICLFIYQLSVLVLIKLRWLRNKRLYYTWIDMFTRFDWLYSLSADDLWGSFAGEK